MNPLQSTREEMRELKSGSRRSMPCSPRREGSDMKQNTAVNSGTIEILLPLICEEMGEEEPKEEGGE